MLESIRYRIPLLLKHKIILYAGITVIAFDIVLAAVYAQILLEPSSILPVLVNENLHMSDSITATVTKGE